MFNDKINNLINEYINRHDDIKLSVGFIVNDKKYFFNYGKKIENDEIYDYEIGSISKTFTAHLIMKYVKLGKVELSKSVGYYLNIGENYPSIYELLTHTSGYKFLTPFNYKITKWIKYFKKNLYENITNDDVLKALIKRKKKKKYNYSYSDFNYAILKLVLEKIAGKSYNELMNEFIKEDLKLNRTFLLNEYRPNTNPVFNNFIVGRWKWNCDNPYLSAGGICSNVCDMVEYMNIELNSKEYFITQCHIVNENTSIRKDKLLICPGWHAYKSGNHLWHVGGVGCYKSSVIISKNKNIAIVGLGNYKGHKSARVNNIVKMIYGYISRNRNKL